MSTIAVLLKESWALVEEQADEFANYFFARIFLLDWRLRDMFPVEMSGQRRRLAETLTTVIQSVDDTDRFESHLRDFGWEHRRFHLTPLTPVHYSIVGGALLDALRRFAGPRWTIEYDQAWRDLYDAMAINVVAGAAVGTAGPPYCHAEVVAHERRGRDLAVITCRPLHPVDIRPGQYVPVECPYLPEHWRPYSVANARRADATLEFHVRARDNGWVSANLVRRLRTGDMLRLRPPAGTMTLDRESFRDVICIAGGTGLAPMKSIVEELGRYNRSRWVHLFVGARDREDLYDLPALVELARRLPWLSLVPACSADVAFPGEHGLISDVVERHGPWIDHDVFVSGPPAMVRATLGVLSRMRVPHPRVRYDPIPTA